MADFDLNPEIDPLIFQVAWAEAGSIQAIQAEGFGRPLIARQWWNETADRVARARAMISERSIQGIQVRKDFIERLDALDKDILKRKK